MTGRVDRSRRIVLVLGSLRCGGAERAGSLLATGLAERGHRVAVATLAGRADDFYGLPDEVERFALDVNHAAPNPIRALGGLRTRIAAVKDVLVSTGAEAALSFLTEVNVVATFAARSAGCPVAISERVDPRLHRERVPWRLLRAWAYPRADVLVANSASVAAHYERRRGSQRVRWIPNFVSPPRPEAIGSPPFELPDGRLIVALGRLVPQKGHDLLLEAWARVRDRTGWHCLIVGEGDAEPLRARARALGVADSVHFPGRAPEPWSLFARSDLFAFPSRYEGFPNALLEAMSAGLPSVAFETPAPGGPSSGASELVRDGHDGWLVPLGDIDGFAAALERAMASEVERRRVGANAREVTERFGSTKVIGLWEELVESLLAR